MSLLSVVRDVCAVVGVIQPTTVFGAINTNRTMAEMLACANEMAQRTAYDNREWREFKTSATFTGDGVTEAFNLPANYLRMLLTTNVWRSTSAVYPMRFISDFDEWQQRRALAYTDPFGEWTLVGNQMLIQPIMQGPITGPPAVAATTAKFTYLDKNCIALNAGGFGDTFQNDADTYRLPERLLKLGMIYDWKMKKGSPYGEDLSTYSDAIAMLMGTNKPMPILSVGQPIGGSTAYPFPTPTSSSWQWPFHP